MDRGFFFRDRKDQSLIRKYAGELPEKDNEEQIVNCCQPSKENECADNYGLQQ
jgi:hypothetical protein